MKPGFLNTKKNKNTTASPQSPTGTHAEGIGGIGPNPPPQPEFVLVEQLERNMVVNFGHNLCQKGSSRQVNEQAFERGVVIVQCDGCGLLMAIADNSPNSSSLFGCGETHKVQHFMKGLGATMPTKSFCSSFCATFETKGKAQTLSRNHKIWEEWAAHVTGGGGDVLDGKIALGVKMERDHSVSYTHPGCSTKTARTVSREAYERGLVVARCTDCHLLFALADRIGWVTIRGGQQSTFEMVIGNLGQNLERGSVDTVCLVPGDMEIIRQLLR